MKKRILGILMVFMTVFALGACTKTYDAGIIKNWYFEDDILHWKTVKNATYYELLFFQEDDEPIPMLSDHYNIYAYSSEYSFGLFQDGDYFIRIRVYSADGTTEDSERIEISIEREYPYPLHLGGNYMLNDLTWSTEGMDRKDFINYTVKINDEEFTVATNDYFMDLQQFSGINEIYVRANYEGGSSKWAGPMYMPLLMESQQTLTYYDLESDTDFTYTFDQDVLCVIGRWGLFSNVVLNEDIVTIDGNEITVNRYYLRTEPHSNLDGIYLSLIVYTDTYVYTLYLTQNVDLIDE